MAQFKMTVRNNVSATGRVKITDDTDWECMRSVVFLVVVQPGQTRHVTVTYTGTASNLGNITETISADKSYTVQLDAFIKSNPSENTEYSTGIIEVRLDAAEPPYYSKQISRTHSTEKC